MRHHRLYIAFRPWLCEVILSARRYVVLLVFSYTVNINLCNAQQDRGDIENRFEQARQLAFSGKREEARVILNEILKSDPEYHDARILLARTYAWNGSYDLSRKELQRVIEVVPVHEDALNALIDVETWAGNFNDALSLSELALEKYPHSHDFLFKKANSLYRLGRTMEASLVLQQLLVVNPAHDLGLRLLSEIRIAAMKYTAGVQYNIDIFDRVFDPAQNISVQLARANKWGSVIGRGNFTDRFSTRGLQGELDIYPRIAKRAYGYINYGFSLSELFPRHRFGAEVYYGFPLHVEGSIGTRYLYFTELRKVLMITGSVGWYYKSYWFSFRPYIGIEKNSQSFSGLLQLRRYFKTVDDYVGLHVGAGFLPDERRFQSTTPAGDARVYLLNSQRVGLQWSKILKRNFLFNLSLDLQRQEFALNSDDFIFMISPGCALKKRF